MKRSFYSLCLVFSVILFLFLFGCEENNLVLPLPINKSSIVTYAGKVYHTVTIGSQTWLKENLDIGTMIDSTKDQTNNGIIEKYCYNGSPDSCTKYGGLYQWAEAVQYKNGATNTTSSNPAFTGNVQGICPWGWHIPSDTDYQTLSATVKNGNALKAVGQKGNHGTGSFDGVGTNTSGFSALYAGFRNDYGNSINLGDETDFWSSTEYNPIYAPCINLFYEGNGIFWGVSTHKNLGYSVRCIKDY